LGTGTASRGALSVAQDVLDVAGGVEGLAHLAVDDLLRVSGVGPPRAARVVAAVELGRRAVTRRGLERPQLKTPRELAEYLLPLYGGHREERFGIVMLDSKYRLLRSDTISIGTLDASIAHPRDIFRAAAIGSAFCIALFHNHPSGDPAPSRDDVALTARLVAAGDLLEIPVVDHVILGAGRYYSFRSEGVLR
jgi:DNA repair protein RadC